MQAVLDAPMGADGGTELVRLGGKRGDVEASLALLALGALAPRDDRDDAAQALPVGMALFEPGKVLDGLHLARLDAAVIAIDARRFGDGDIGEAARQLLREQKLHVVVQAPRKRPMMTAFRRTGWIG
ncbi:hypothetical protein [Mesorhizobium sp. CN2-181]|uniref:hypothetical protein n=1 Tax=Mesorhizobium yinganensis TaxID=3157707 RepID=UPI0032B7C9F2